MCNVTVVERSHLCIFGLPTIKVVTEWTAKGVILVIKTGCNSIIFLCTTVCLHYTVVDNSHTTDHHINTGYDNQ